MMVLGQKGGAWDKCRSGWLGLAGAHGLDPSGATVLYREKQQLANLSSGKRRSNERSFRGTERGPSHRIINALKGPLYFSG